MEPEDMVPINGKRLALTISIVSFLFGANLWLLYSAPGHERFDRSPIYPVFRKTREFVLSPGCVTIIAAFIVLSLRWALTGHKRQISELERLAGIAVALATALGLLMTHLYNP